MDEHELVGVYLDHYWIQEKLSIGGMSTVYRGYNTRLQQTVAIKVILARIQNSAKYLRRFELESKVLTRLNHPNIVGIMDYGKDKGWPYLVMPYIPGGTLKERIRGPWDVAAAAQVLAPVAWALQYAHERHVLHRDVKPSNILFTEDGRPMLTDFGIAKLVNLEQTLDLTDTGFAFGSVEYMSPEAALNRPIDFRADVYSLGVVLFELVTGLKPFRGDNPVAVLHQQAYDPAPDPRQFVPDLPEPVAHIILHALEKEPDRRFSTMRIFAEILSHWGNVPVPQETVLPEEWEKEPEPDMDNHGTVPNVKGEQTKEPAAAVSPGRYSSAAPASRRYTRPLVIGGFMLVLAMAICVFGIVTVRNLANQASQSNISATLEAAGLPIPNTGTDPADEQPTTAAGPTETGGRPVPTEPAFITLTPMEDNSWQQGKLAFLARRERGNDLIVMDLDPLTQPRKLFPQDDNPFLMGAAWSPDGDRVAYYQLGGQMQSLTVIGGQDPELYGLCNSPSWSADSSRLICKANSANAFQIYDAETGDLLDEIPANGLLPVWSPQGNAIAFSVNNSGRTSLWLMPMESEEPILLVDSNGEDYAAAWSPDGEWIAYQSSEGSSNSEIWLIDKNGQNRRRLTVTPDGYWSRGPGWSPDGRWLVYVSNQAGSFGNDYGELFMASVEDGKVFQLTHTGGLIYDWRVSWGR